MKNKYQKQYWIWSSFILLIVTTIVYFKTIQTPPSPHGQIYQLLIVINWFFWLYFIFDFNFVHFYLSRIVNRYKENYPQIEIFEEDHRSESLKKSGIFLKIAAVPYIAIGIIYLWLFLSHQNYLMIYPEMLLLFWTALLMTLFSSFDKFLTNNFTKKVDELIEENEKKNEEQTK